MYLDEFFKKAPHILINQLSCDSRVPMKDCIFFCIKGIKYNGHEFIDEAIDNGANVIVYQDEIEIKRNVVFVKVNNVLDVLTSISSKFYDYPASKLESYLVSGTNGRSSVSYIINTILSKYKKCSSIGVFGIKYGDTNLLSNQATLTILDNQKTLETFHKQGCEVCTLEASAMSLAYKKLDMLNPNCFIYTSTQIDNPEYIESGVDYVDSLKRYLYSLNDSTNVVLNIDDELTFNNLYNAAGNLKVSYGLNSNADYRIEDIKLYNNHTSFNLRVEGKTYPISTNLLGLNNVYNVTAAIAALRQMNYPINTIIKDIEEIECVDGIIDHLNFDDYNIYVDAASSYSSIDNALKYGKSMTSKDNRLIALISINTTDTINRLKNLMDVACKYADLIVLSEDDTYEDDIIDVLKKATNYIDSTRYLIIEDREEAIEESIELMNKHDTLMLLGKGNEKFLYKGLVKKDYIGDKNLAYKYMNKRLKEEAEYIENY